MLPRRVALMYRIEAKRDFITSFFLFTHSFDHTNCRKTPTHVHNSPRVPSEKIVADAVEFLLTLSLTEMKGTAEMPPRLL